MPGITTVPTFELFLNVISPGSPLAAHDPGTAVIDRVAAGVDASCSSIDRRLKMTVTLDRYRPMMLSILRIVVALLFVEHGLMKLVGFPGPQPGVSHPLPTLLLAAALIEVIAGTLVAVGLFTRAAAFLSSGEMAAAYFIAHAPRGFWPALNEGEPAILFCFVFLFLVFAGGGSIGVDALRGANGRE